MFIVAPRSLDLEETLSDLHMEYQFEVVKVPAPKASEGDNSAELDKVLTTLKGIKKNVILAGAPMNLNQCYKLLENNVIPVKVLILKDSAEAMSNYYLEHEYTQDYKVSDLLAEDERNKLSQVQEFYKGCCIEFDERESGEIDSIKVMSMF